MSGSAELAQLDTTPSPVPVLEYSRRRCFSPMSNSPNAADPTGSSAQNDSHEKRRLIVVTSGKGGTGKSFFARVLLDHYNDQNRRVIAVDTSESRSTFFAFVHDEETCRYCDLSKESAFDGLIDLCRDHGLVLMDLASGTQGRIEKWLNAPRSVEQVRALNIEITMFFMVNGEPETVAALARGIKALENIGQIIAVRNFGRATDFAAYDQDPVNTTLSQRAAVIDLPELELADKTSLTRLRIRFRDATPNSSRSGEVGFLDSRRIDIFMKSAKSQLALVEAHLS